MDDSEVAAHWDENAAEWVRGVRCGWDIYRTYVNNPAFFALLPELEGLRVLDIGCGEGFNTRLFAERGATVVGIDVSSKMIDAARALEDQTSPAIEYHHTPANDLSRFADASFDAALSTMALMDMSDYAGCIGETARVLKPGGLFQFSILHPCMMTRAWRWARDERGERVGVVAGDYFGLLTPPGGDTSDVDEWIFTGVPSDMRAAARPFRVPRFFRTLSAYINTLVDAGFTIERLVEPHADEEVAATQPDVADTRIIPYFLIIVARA